MFGFNQLQLKVDRIIKILDEDPAQKDAVLNLLQKTLAAQQHNKKASETKSEDNQLRQKTPQNNSAFQAYPKQPPKKPTVVAADPRSPVTFSQPGRSYSFVGTGRPVTPVASPEPLMRSGSNGEFIDRGHSPDDPALGGFTNS